MTSCAFRVDQGVSLARNLHQCTLKSRGCGAKIQVPGGSSLAGKWAKIRFWPCGNNPEGIDGFVTAVIMLFDVIKVHRFRYPRHSVEPFHIAGNMAIFGELVAVAFEMAVVDGVKANQRGEQSPVRFG